MNRYKTKDGVDRIIPGIGRTTNGVIDTPHKIENPMFELVSDNVQTPAPATPPIAPTTNAVGPTPVLPPQPTPSPQQPSGVTQTPNQEIQ